MRNWLSRIWKDNKSLILFILLMSVFRSAVADWNTVPTGSMKPTILEGDRILVNKMAYDLRVPFTHLSIYRMSEPQRGDIVVFDSRATNNKLVKRVVGIPGDIVELRNNSLIINGRILDYQTMEVAAETLDRSEDLLGIKHGVRVSKSGSAFSSFRAVVVPADRYLVLGDNRDNSADSRVIGFVPRTEIVGRSRSVVMSFNYENFYIPRSDRFFHVL